MLPPPPISTLFPYTTLFRSDPIQAALAEAFVLSNSANLIHLRLDISGNERAVATHAPFQINEVVRSEEHTSELQSRRDLVCRLLLEKKNAGHRSGRGVVVGV